MVACREVEPVLERGGGYERVGQSKVDVSADPPGALGNWAIDGELAKRREQLRHDIGRGGTGEQLSTCDH